MGKKRKKYRIGVATCSLLETSSRHEGAKDGQNKRGSGRKGEGTQVGVKNVPKDRVSENLQLGTTNAAGWQKKKLRKVMQALEGTTGDGVPGPAP